MHLTRPSDQSADRLYSRHVNPQWVKLLDTLSLNERFVRCEGAELFTDTGERYLDFLSGYGVYNTGHHHPKIRAALVDELSRFRPTMLQSYVPELAAELAGRLSKLARGSLERVFFTSSGSEGVETVIKFSRAFTKRDRILACDGAFHGLTCGALSLMSNGWWREGFGPLLPGTATVPFGDVDALERELRSRSYASFIVEPIQGESGVTVPPESYLRTAEELCRRHGTLFVLDEVQTGLYRTGPFLAAHHFGVTPDMVVLAKAMSGGYVPVGAVLMRTDISEAVYCSLEKAFVHASTFGENALAMRAALATLDVLEEENLGAQAIERGEYLRRRVNALAQSTDMLRGAQGVGLMNGVVFEPPTRLGQKLLFSGFTKLHPALFAQMVVRQLFCDANILTQVCGNNYMTIKACPPLVVTEKQLDVFVDALQELLETIADGKARFWSQGIQIAARSLKQAA